MIVIGLTGGIGSGKSLASQLFAKKGIPVIDADVIAREVTSPNQPAFHDIVKHFGTLILSDNGQLNRKKLRDIIFKDAKERKWLESLLHPLILKRMADEITHLSTPYCIAVIPLLVETKSNHFIDRQLLIDVTPTIQMERIIHRDQMTEEEAKKMIAAQATRHERLAEADDVINNDAGLKELEEEVDRLHEVYLKLSRL